MAQKDPAQIQLEKDIRKLEYEVDVSLLEASEEDFSPMLRDLRDRVFLAHSSVEADIDFEILCKVMQSSLPGDTTSKNIDIKEFVSFSIVFSSVQKGSSFVRKIDLLKELKGLDDDFYTQIKGLNNIRVDFAHPKDKKYKKYENLEEYKKALGTIANVLQKFKDIRSKPFYPKINVEKK